MARANCPRRERHDPRAAFRLRGNGHASRPGGVSPVGPWSLIPCAPERERRQRRPMTLACIPLPHRGVLALSGEDVHGFLQGLLSNDMERVRAGSAVYAALLTPAGQVPARCLRGGMRGHGLSRRRVGPVGRSLEAAQALPAAGEDRHRGCKRRLGGGGCAAGGGAFRPRRRRAGARPRAPAPASPMSIRATAGSGCGCCARRDAPTGLPKGDFADYEALRYRLGAPDGSRDMPVGQAFLLESGFERLNGVDWEKGCYVGQEVTARYPLSRRRTEATRAGGARRPGGKPGTRIAVAGRPVGEMRSSLNGLGLALLRLDRIGGRRRAGSRRRTPPGSRKRTLNPDQLGTSPAVHVPGPVR